MDLLSEVITFVMDFLSEVKTFVMDLLSEVITFVWSIVNLENLISILMGALINLSLSLLDLTTTGY